MKKKTKKKPEPEDILWVVNSYNDDQQQDFFDLVLAPTEDEAKEFISTLRPYAIVTHCQTVADNLFYAKKIAKTNIAEFKKNKVTYYKDVLDEQNRMICEKCEVICDDDPTGLCETCGKRD